jgi:hypothetical protein
VSGTHPKTRALQLWKTWPSDRPSIKRHLRPGPHGSCSKRRFHNAWLYGASLLRPSRGVPVRVLPTYVVLIRFTVGARCGRTDGSQRRAGGGACGGGWFLSRWVATAVGRTTQSESRLPGSMWALACGRARIVSYRRLVVVTRLGSLCFVRALMGGNSARGASARAGRRIHPTWTAPIHPGRLLVCSVEMQD